MPPALDASGHRSTLGARMLRAFAIVLAALVLAVPPSAGARRIRVACTDGDARCDRDGRCDGVCRLVLGARRVPLAVPLRRGDTPGRRVRRVGHDVMVVRCLASSGGCKPPLTTGCKADMEREACVAHEGDFGAGGLSPQPGCRCRTTDAGTPCSSENDCQGMCLAPLSQDPPVFKCSGHTTEFGCFAILDPNGTRASLCID